MFKMGNQQGTTCIAQETVLNVYDSLEGREVWGRMDISICMAESLCHPPETITFLISYVLYTVLITQSCMTLCDPMDNTIHGILQARILEWVAFPFSRGSSQTRDQTRSPVLQADSFPAEPQGKPSGV